MPRGNRSGGARAALLAYLVKTAVVLTDKGRAGDEKDEVSSHPEAPHKMEIPMSIRTGLIAALYTASVASACAEPLVQRAGEWETTIDTGKPITRCFPTDIIVDRDYVLRSMSKLPGANCSIGNIATLGAVTSYSMQCTIGGSTMTASGTITATGPDSFSGKAHSHGGAIKMPNGKETALQDMDVVTVSRRVGPCKPADPQAKH
jgi:hypothetical protein